MARQAHNASAATVLPGRAVPALPASVLWSSRFAVYLGTASAAVGLGSIWRFPYLAGTGGGSAFILVFVLACGLIAAPLLVAELALGRRSRRSPPDAAGAVAVEAGLSRGWNVIGILGSAAAFLIISYYAVIAGWVLAYTWKCATGVLAAAGTSHVDRLWRSFLSDPWQVGAWHMAFLALVALISARGLQGGVELANKVRAPALLVLVLILVGYSLATGDVRRGLTFAFAPHLAAIHSQTLLVAIGQAFYATGVGQAMMIAYGAYVGPGTSLVRTSLLITGSILLVSLLAALMIFPLVFRYGLNPAQGTELVFEVLPRAFAEMPAGRIIGTLFFLLLVLAALMPSVASLEPAVAWLIQRFGLGRAPAACAVAGSAWLIGIGSVLSFNWWSAWHPLGLVPVLADKTFFDVMDYVSANVLLPIGAFFTCVLAGWRLSSILITHELAETTPQALRACRWLLRYVCPLAIVAVFLAALA
jgi:NSS family neurotransmitter:Na+ symporter